MSFSAALLFALEKGWLVAALTAFFSYYMASRSKRRVLEDATLTAMATLTTKVEGFAAEIAEFRIDMREARRENQDLSNEAIAITRRALQVGVEAKEAAQGAFDVGNHNNEKIVSLGLAIAKKPAPKKK